MTETVNETDIESQVEIKSNDIIMDNTPIDKEDDIIGQVVQSVNEERIDVIYKSKNEIIKEKAVYFFVGILLSAIFYILIRNKA